MSVPKYRVIKKLKLQDLEAEVNSLIIEGWVPHGGIAVTFIPFNQETIYYQSMLRSY